MLSSVSVWFLTSTLLAVGIAVLAFWSRRRDLAVSEFSEQIRRLTIEPGIAGRVGLAGQSQSLELLGEAVNKLLDNLEQRGATLQGREQLFQRLVESVHHAVLVHGKQILFANSRFLSLLGMNAADVVGRPLSDFVAPEYVELVQANLRRRLAAEPAAERYEVELVGAHGEFTRVELVEQPDRQPRRAGAAAHGSGDAARGLDRGAGAAAASRRRLSTQWAKASSPWTPRGVSITSINLPRRCWASGSTRSSARPFPTSPRWWTNRTVIHWEIRSAWRWHQAAASRWADARCWCRRTVSRSDPWSSA